MEIKLLTKDNVCDIALSGRLDAANAYEFEEKIAEIPQNVENINLNVKDLEYISSSGLRCIMVLIKRVDGKGKLVVLNPNEMVTNVLDMTGIASLVEIK